LVQSLEATRSGLNETRRALRALRASPLDDLGLTLALRKLAESAGERNGMHVALKLPERTPILSPDVEQCVYRVAQEAVENALQHADAHNLALHLACDETGIRLTVQDDGLGFDLAKDEAAGHFGLAGMRERAQLAGGELSIESQPGGGTQVELRIRA
jgi:signal transduction histidine kinase